MFKKEKIKDLHSILRIFSGLAMTVTTPGRSPESINGCSTVFMLCGKEGV
jgi:hypothetical protein